MRRSNARAALLFVVALCAAGGARATTGGASAAGQSIAIGGPVSGSSICNNCVGLTSAQVKTLLAANDRNWRDLSASDRSLIASLRGNLDKAQSDSEGLKEKQTITDAALRGFFATLGQDNPPPDRLPEVLGQIAGAFVKARAGTGADPTDTPEIRNLKTQARAALDANRKADADALLARIADAQRAAASPILEQLAATVGQRGYLAMSSLKYAEAAEFFEQAAAIDSVPERRNAYRASEAGALYTLGTDRGDNLALRRSIEIQRALLAGTSRERNPELWAHTENNLSLAVEMLGLRQTDSALLMEALSGFGETIKVFTRERSPLLWAETEHNIGSVLVDLGEREPGTQRLEEAVKVFNLALLERTHERTPLPWAMTENNLGHALARIGERRAGVEDLQAAVKAFDAAESVITRDHYPLLWVLAESNRASVLMRLGQREPGLGNLDAAANSYRALLAVATRETQPMEWAANENNFGNALVSLDLRQGGTAHLPDAIAAFNAALLENTQDHDVVRWAQTQIDLGIAYETLGQRTRSPDALRSALTAYRSAQSVFSTPSFPTQVALLDAALDRCNAILAQLTKPSTAAANP